MPFIDFPWRAPIIPTWIDLPDLLHEIYWFLEWEIKFYDVSWIFFSYVYFFISWFAARHRCRSWMRRNHAKKWNWFTCPTCVSFSLKTNFFFLGLCLPELFSERSALSSALSAVVMQPKIEQKTFTKVLSNSRAPSSSHVNNQRGWRDLRTRSHNVWVIECSITSNGDL